MKYKVFLLAMAMSIFFKSFTQNVKTIWSTQPVLKVPESVFYDASAKRIYVSNINGKPAAKDGNGFISIIDTKGNVIKLKWITGLNAPKGITKCGNKLFVTDIDRIAEIDIGKGKISKFYHVQGSVFLNDIICDKNGDIFISDSGKGVIYKLNGTKVILWLNDNVLKGANGLATENGFLLIGTQNGIVKADNGTKTLSVLIKHKGMIDGLIPAGNGKYIISDWKGKIEIIGQKGKAVLVRNTAAKNINAADLGFINGENIILVPTFFDNRVVAVELGSY